MKITGQQPTSTNRFVLDAIEQLSDNSIMTRGGQTVDSENTSTKKQKRKVYQYELGDREGNTRIVKPQSVSVCVQTFFSGHGTSNQVGSADGYVGDSAQGKRGDCYLLAEINAIRNTTHGQALLNNNLEWHGEDAVTVTLPGAVKIRKEYERQGLPCEVTGIYYITKEALIKAKNLAGKSYSQSEIEVIAFEVAMENYRAEMTATNKLNKNRPIIQGTAEGNVNHHSDETHDFLSSGQMYDAGFLLTGEKSEVYRADNDKRKHAKLYMHGQHGFITREQLALQTDVDTTMYKASLGVVEYTSYSEDEQKLDDMLNKYEGRENDFALTCAVIVGEDGPDGSTKARGGHALTVVKITKDTVYVANPWTPDKIEPIPRQEFVKMCTGFDALEIKDPDTHEATQQDLGNRIQSIMGKMNANQFANNPTTQTLDPNKLNQLITHFNNQTSNTSSHLNMSRLLQLLNSTASANLSEDERQRLSGLISSLSTDSNQPQIDVETIRYFQQKFSDNQT